MKASASEIGVLAQVEGVELGEALVALGAEGVLGVVGIDDRHLSFFSLVSSIAVVVVVWLQLPKRDHNSMHNVDNGSANCSNVAGSFMRMFLL